MKWNLFMHCAGIVCLAGIAAIAFSVIFTAIVPNWARIWDTACGRPWPISRHPASPTASVLPLGTRHTPLPIVEADPQLTRKAS